MIFVTGAFACLAAFFAGLCAGLISREKNLSAVKGYTRKASIKPDDTLCEEYRNFLNYDGSDTV